MEFKIKLANTNEVLDLRHKILRAHLPKEDSLYPTDDLESSFHLAAFTNENVVIGVASFFPEKYQNADHAYRLRGMASAENARGLGVGKALLLEAFKELKDRGCDILWCNAREIAFPFYEKLGFNFDSEMFEIANIGPHKIMSRKI
ncbi:MAG: GNAT family N-acetyltransferase [Bdellovibrionota bacterium]|nr:GNAT family N-acetyltransferase [Pseudobdellovibrionaceae bacterium]|tara:strand:+ start:9232 stop:9669 length:438 start_codon:yes stop_codon:yes gene_type:complete